MNINFTKSFSNSLNRIMIQNSWWYKTYSFFRWDLWHFFANVWRFRKELWNHSWWDYRFTLEMMYRSISIMEKGMHNGLEVRETRDKKIQKMQRLLQLLDNKINDRYIELAEKELGYEMKLNPIEFEEIDETDSDGQKLYRMVNIDNDEDKKLNDNLFDKSREIEETEWKEIWRILEGQPYTEYINYNKLDVEDEKLSLEQKLNKSNDKWNDWFDGTGLRGWWD